jgi:hypothetical protein
MIKDWTHVSRIRCIPKMESLGPQVAHPGFVPTVGRNCYDVTSTSVIVSNHVCMPMTMVSDKISNPIWMAGLVDRLAREGNTQRA